MVPWLCEIGLVAGGEVVGGGAVDLVCTSKYCVNKKKKEVLLNGVIGGVTFGFPVGYSNIEVELEDGESSYAAFNLAGKFEIHAFGMAIVSGAGYAEIQSGKGTGKTSGWDWGAGVGLAFDNFWGHVEVKHQKEVCCE